MNKCNSSATVLCVALGLTVVVIPSDLRGFCAAQQTSSSPVIKDRARNSIDEHGIFEKYDNGKNVKERRERLDAFAIFLKENPHFEAYIMSYGGRRSFLREAKTRGQDAKKYLVKVKGIKARRITVIDAGYHENWVVELWYGVAGGPPPVPLPTIHKKHIKMRSAKS